MLVLAEYADALVSHAVEETLRDGDGTRCDEVEGVGLVALLDDGLLWESERGLHEGEDEVQEPFKRREGGTIRGAVMFSAGEEARCSCAQRYGSSGRAEGVELRGSEEVMQRAEEHIAEEHAHVEPSVDGTLERGREHGDEVGEIVLAMERFVSGKDVELDDLA